MGSWLGTCGITQLPINYGDKIRAFVIVPGYVDIIHESKGFSYSDSIWKLFGVGIKCQYEDYGRVYKIKKDLSSKILEKAFDENVKNASKIISDDNKELKGIEKYMFLIGDDSFVNKRDQPFGIFYVLEDIYQAMANYNPIERDNGGYQSLKTILTDDTYRWYNNQLNTPKKYFGFDRVRISQSPSGSLNYCVLNAFKDCIDKKLTISNKKVKELIELAIENYMFEHSMLSARKAWMPQAGAGSQSDELNIYRKIAVATQKVIDVSIKKRVREYGKDYNIDDETYTKSQIEVNNKIFEE